MLAGRVRVVSYSRRAPAIRRLPPTKEVASIFRIADLEKKTWGGGGVEIEHQANPGKTFAQGHTHTQKIGSEGVSVWTCVDILHRATSELRSCGIHKSGVRTPEA